MRRELAHLAVGIVVVTTTTIVAAITALRRRTLIVRVGLTVRILIIRHGCYCVNILEMKPVVLESIAHRRECVDGLVVGLLELESID